MSARASVLEHNLRLLFTRAWVPVAPRESFRAALERDFTARAARRYGRAGRPDRPFWLRPVPLVAALAAACLLAWFAFAALGGLREEKPRDDVVVAQGHVAVRQGDGPWEAHRPEPGATVAALGRREAPLEVVTPAAVGAELAVGPVGLELGTAARLSMVDERTAELLAGSLTLDLESDAELRVCTPEGGVDLEGALAQLTLETEPVGHVRVDVSSGRALVDDGPAQRRLGAGDSVRMADGRVFAEPATTAVASGTAARTAVEAAPPPVEVDEASEPVPALRGTVGVLARAEDGTERVQPVRSFRALLLENVDLPAARMPLVLDVVDEQGRFAFGPATPGTYTLFVQAEGHAVGRVEGLALSDGGTLDVAVELERGTTVRGVVLDAESGEPIADAVVVSETDAPVRVLPIDTESLQEMGFVRFVHTGPDGGFELVDLSRGVQILRASGGGRSVAWAPDLELQGGAPYEGVEFSLPAAGAVAGEVRDIDGLPREGVVLLASCSDFEQSRPCLSFKQAMTDATGSYRIDGLPPGPAAVLLFEDPDEMDSQAAPDLRLTVVRAKATVQVDFAPARAGVRLEGRALDASGAPLAGRSVWSVVWGVELDEEAFTSTTTRADGSFVFEGLEPGRHDLYVSGQRPPDMIFVAQVDLPESGLREVELRAGTSTLTGHVLAAATLDPVVAGQVVALERSSGRFGGRVLLATDGSFRFDGLHGGVYDLHVEPTAARLGATVLEAIVVPDGESVSGLELLVPAAGGR